jgi:hypothetical protein
MNMVGNVLGTLGYHTNYESVPPLFTGHETSIYRLGDNGNTLPASKQDTLVKSTLLRWGNYDVVTATARFLASEVPSGIKKFANPVPGDQTLPASLYLPGKPTWWPSAIPWPCIGPDVTGGDMTGLAGHAYKIPAHVCYDNSSKTNGILNFNANNCYGNSYSGVKQFPDAAIPGQAHSMKIFARSVQGKIYLEIGGAGGLSQANVAVYAIDGKRIAQKTINVGINGTIDMPGISRGVYFVKVSNDHVSLCGRIMVTR